MADFTDDDNALLEELGVEVESKKVQTYTAREERIIAGFEEIQRFVEEHARTPTHREDADIFERLYAVRLDRIRELEECRALVAPMDHQALLSIPEAMTAIPVEEMDDEALLAELGVDDTESDLTNLQHVRSNAEKRVAEEVAKRDRCEDFELFKPLFDQTVADLGSGVRISAVIRKAVGFVKTDIKPGEFFILGGQMLYVAESGEPIKAPNGDMDARLRVIYSNGTESNILLRSLQRALYKDENSRRISEVDDGPLFAESAEEADVASGVIYVLRSRSDLPIVSENRDVLHKIGVTSGSVESRVTNAKKDPTYLLADVEVVMTYKLYNINCRKLERLIHQVFSSARLDVEIQDRFGELVSPREWFLVPLFVIDEAVERIKDGSIAGYAYDPDSAELKKI